HHLSAYDGTNFQCLSCGGSTDGFVTVQQMMDSITNAIDTISGGGGSVIYNGQSPTRVSVGGLASGSAISGESFENIIQAIVAPYVNPVFNSFSVSAQATTLEMGSTLSGSKTFTWNITQNSGTVPTIDIYDITAASTLVSGTASDGSHSATITTNQLN